MRQKYSNWNNLTFKSELTSLELGCVMRCTDRTYTACSGTENVANEGHRPRSTASTRVFTKLRAALAAIDGPFRMTLFQGWFLAMTSAACLVAVLLTRKLLRVSMISLLVCVCGN